MKADTIEVRDLFENRQIFCVPIYQRHYVWDRKKQLPPLWEAVRAKASHRLSEEKSENVPHFMGAVVLDGDKADADKVPSIQVIDGQQRLITFQILLAAIRDYANSMNIEEASRQIERFLTNGDKHLMGDPENEIFKLRPTQYDQEMFKDIIGVDDENRGLIALNKKHSEHFYARKWEIYPRSTVPRMLSAYGYFYDSIERTFQGEGDDINDDFSDKDQHDPKIKLGAIWKSVVTDFKFVKIQLEGNDEAQTIFETLNYLGEPLLAADLVRNNIFHRLHKDVKGDGIEELFNSHWGPFEDTFWSVVEKQGRYKKQRIELFLAHYISAKMKKIVNLTNLFSEYKNFIHTRPFQDVPEELEELVRFGKIYRTIIDHESNDTLSHFARRLLPWDVSTIFPLVMRVYSEEGLSEDQKKSYFNLLISFVVRRAICGLTPKNYNKFFLSAISFLDDKSWSYDSLAEFFLQYDAETSLFPNDERFKRSWVDTPIYRTLGARSSVLLREIEQKMLTTKHEYKSPPEERLTVEHILPQTWYGEDWLLPDGTEASVQESLEAYELLEEDDSKLGQIKRRNRLKDTIGNLTLLTQPLNSSVSNGPFNDKREALADDSLLMMNKDIAKAEKWDEDEIIKRGEKLFELARKIWPMPEEN